MYILSLYVLAGRCCCLATVNQHCTGTLELIDVLEQATLSENDSVSLNSACDSTRDLHTCRRWAQQGSLGRQLHSLFETSCLQHDHQAACSEKLNQVLKPLTASKALQRAQHM